MLPISISRFGISIKMPGSLGDRLLIRWPFSKKPLWYSYFYNRDFNRIWDYLKFLRSDKKSEDLLYSNSERIVGISFESMAGQWLHNMFPYEYVVILKNIDVSKKDPAFWMRLSKDKIAPFIQRDFVMLRCKDKSSASNLVAEIPSEFAEAIAFENGNPFLYNERHGI